MSLCASVYIFFVVCLLSPFFFNSFGIPGMYRNVGSIFVFFVLSLYIALVQSQRIKSDSKKKNNLICGL